MKSETFSGQASGVSVLSLDGVPKRSNSIEVKDEEGQYLGGWVYKEGPNCIVRIYGRFPPGKDNITVEYEETTETDSEEEEPTDDEE